MLVKLASTESFWKIKVLWSSEKFWKVWNAKRNCGSTSLVESQSTSNLFTLPVQVPSAPFNDERSKDGAGREANKEGTDAAWGSKWIKVDRSGSKWIKHAKLHWETAEILRDFQRVSAHAASTVLPRFLPSCQRDSAALAIPVGYANPRKFRYDAGHLQNFSEKLVQQHEWQCPCRCHLQTQMNSSLEIMIKSVSGRCGSNSCSNYEHFMIILPSDSLTAILLHRYFECDLKCS